MGLFSFSFCHAVKVERLNLGFLCVSVDVNIFVVLDNPKLLSMF